MREISDSITYPMESDDWIKTLLIGGVLTIFSLLLVPLFLVYGYLMRVIRVGSDESAPPPTFGDWGALLVEGAKAFVIGLIYMLVPLFVAGASVGGSVFAMATGSTAGAAGGLLGIFVGLLASLLLAVVFGYFATIALVNFAREKEFVAAFDIAVFKIVALDADYIGAWLASIAILVAAGIVGMIVSLVPLIGFFIGALVGFYAAIVAAVLWANGFAKASDLPPTAERESPEESPV